MAKGMTIVVFRVDNGFIVKIPDTSITGMLGEKKEKISICKDMKETLDVIASYINGL